MSKKNVFWHVLWHADCSAWRGFRWSEYWHIRTELAAFINDWAGINMEIQSLDCHYIKHLLRNFLKKKVYDLGRQVVEHISIRRMVVFSLSILLSRKVFCFFLQGLVGVSQKVKWRGTWVVKTVIKRHSVFLFLLQWFIKAFWIILILILNSIYLLQGVLCKS